MDTLYETYEKNIPKAPDQYPDELPNFLKKTSCPSCDREIMVSKKLNLIPTHLTPDGDMCESSNQEYSTPSTNESN